MNVVPEFKQHTLTRLFSVGAILSADFIMGKHISRSPHAHKDARELVFCSEKNCRVLCGEQWVRVGKDQVMLIRPGLTHDIEVSDEDARVFVLSFTCSGGANLLPLEHRLLSVSDSSVALNLAAQIKAELLSGFQTKDQRLSLSTFIPSPESPIGTEQMICCSLEMLLIVLLRDATMQNGDVVPEGELKATVSSYFINQVSLYVKAHIQEKITVSSVAAHFHYSRSRLSVLYKEATGVSLGEFILNTRLDFAKYLMKSCGLSVTATAEKSGFCSPQYFSHVFLEKNGCTPSAYIKKGSESK